MKLTYFGTSAAEGFPALFCNCEYCKMARQLGGKNIRTRSQAMINDDLLIDLPADTYAHFLANDVQGHKIRYLIVTHSHSDHLYTTNLALRQGAYAHEMDVPTLQIYCGQGAYDKITSIQPMPMGIAVNLVRAFEPFCLDGYTVTPLPARHYSGDAALFYIIQGDKTILYAHDTGFFYEEVFAYLEKNKFRFDMISLDCTNVDLTIGDDGGHMGLENIARLTERLRAIGAVDEQTQKYVNHFSHNANPIHHLLEERVRDMGFNVSYDGHNVNL